MVIETRLTFSHMQRTRDFNSRSPGSYTGDPGALPAGEGRRHIFGERSEMCKDQEASLQIGRS